MYSDSMRPYVTGGVIQGAGACVGDVRGSCNLPGSRSSVFNRLGRDSGVQGGRGSADSRVSRGGDKSSVFLRLGRDSSVGCGSESFSPSQRTRGVIFGHSFVSRLQKSLQPVGSRPLRNFCIPLGLANDVEHIKLIGKGGAKINDLANFFDSVRYSKDIDFMIIDIGTNDLCDMIDGKTLAQELIDRAKNLLLHHQSLKQIHFNLIVRRDRCRQLSRDQFESKRVAFNDELKASVSNITNIFWFQTSLLDNDIRKWSSDGIHPNTQFGMETYTNNVRHRVSLIVEHMRSG